MSTQLFNMAKKLGVKIEFFSFRWPIQGLYYREKGLVPVIGIDTKLTEDISKMRCVLSEEIGHHITTSGKILTAKFCSKAHKIAENRAEYVAVKWAAQYLIPFDRIKNNLERGDDVKTIAREYRVTERMAEFRLKLPDINRRKGLIRKAITGPAVFFVLNLVKAECM